MKRDLAPKYIQPIHEDATILWFHTSNRYVIIDNPLAKLVSIFLSTQDYNHFSTELKAQYQFSNSRCIAVYNEIYDFLKDANESLQTLFTANILVELGKTPLELYYQFKNTIVQVNYESEAIQHLVHPQIAHHQINHAASYDIVFDLLTSQDALHLFKNKQHLGTYKNSEPHLLQGTFALELTNTIHKLHIDNWVATFHASTVTNNKEAIMIIGDSGNGKSTLSALLMANGLDVLADDFTPLYEDMHLYRYPAAISVKKGAFELLTPLIENFETLNIYKSGSKNVKLKYVPPILEFENTITNLPCNTIVFVKFDSSQPSSLSPVSVATLVETLIPEAWVSPNEAHALQFINWLTTLKCYTLTYSDSIFAVRKFKALFEQH